MSKADNTVCLCGVRHFKSSCSACKQTEDHFLLPRILLMHFVIVIGLLMLQYVTDMHNISFFVSFLFLFWHYRNIKDDSSPTIKKKKQKQKEKGLYGNYQCVQLYFFKLFALYQKLQIQECPRPLSFFIYFFK